MLNLYYQHLRLTSSTIELEDTTLDTAINYLFHSVDTPPTGVYTLRDEDTGRTVLYVNFNYPDLS